MEVRDIGLQSDSRAEHAALCLVIFSEERKVLIKKKGKKSTDDTRQSHHKEHSLTDRCRRCILLLRGSSRSQCKILGGAVWLPQVLNQSRSCQCPCVGFVQSGTVSLIKPTTSHIRSILKYYWIGTGGQSMEKSAYQIDITVRN